MDRTAADEHGRKSTFLPPELLLKVFGYVSDRHTQLALRSVCKNFRSMVDRYGGPGRRPACKYTIFLEQYRGISLRKSTLHIHPTFSIFVCSEIFSTASCTLPARFDGPAGSLCGMARVQCLPSQLHQLSEASTHIKALAFWSVDEPGGYEAGCPIFNSALTSTSEVMHLATWPALAKLSCKLEFDGFIAFSPTSFSALRELNVQIPRCNPSYAALIGSMCGLETLHIGDCGALLDHRRGDPSPSFYWHPDTYPTFATSLWAAVAGLPRLSELRLRTEQLDDGDTLAPFLNAPEGSFPSLRRVELNVLPWPVLAEVTVSPREAGQFVKQFPRLEHLSIVGCGDWPEGMDHLPWPQLKDLRLGLRDSRSQLPSGIRNMTHLQTLSVYGAYGVTFLPQWIGTLTRLTELAISDSPMPSLPQSVTKLHHLTSLDVSCSALAKLPDDIGRLVALTSLNLDDCRLTTALPRSMAELTRLANLSLKLMDEVGLCQFLESKLHTHCPASNCIHKTLSMSFSASWIRAVTVHTHTHK